MAGLVLLIPDAAVTLVLLPVMVNVATGGTLAPLTSWTGRLSAHCCLRPSHSTCASGAVTTASPRGFPTTRRTGNALDRVDRFIRERLENSLSENVRIALSLNKQPTKVLQQSPLRVRALDSPPREHFGSVHEAFEALDESMLVRGAPGSGKTTMLLELAVTRGHPRTSVMELDTAGFR